MNPAPHAMHVDLVIIGGGVAGLWLANRARRSGFSTLLFESKALGSDQTLASQGMIHGGMKYTLAGTLTGASEAIADMPKHWRACLCGEGDVDLRHTRILSDHFFMWSGDGVTNRLTSFLASKITRGRIDPVGQDHRPPLLRHKDFRGSLYRLEDLVIDTPSLVANLAANIPGVCYQIDWSQARLQRDAQGRISLKLITAGGERTLYAQRFIFTAGKGNAALLAELGLDTPAMQLRPLQQIMVKHQHPFDFFGHCLGQDTTPRLTLSSHRLPDGARIWYLGGSLAEKGATMTSAELIGEAQQELATLFPWVNLETAEWASLNIDRAEPRQPQFARPDNAFVAPAPQTENLLVGWPTKLTLAPNLANQVLEQLASAGITPTHSQPSLLGELPLAELAKTPWEHSFPPAVDIETSLALRFHEPEEDPLPGRRDHAS